MKLVKKGDLLIIVLVIMAGALITFFLSQERGRYVEIICNGKLYGEYSLNENKSFTVESEFGWNEIVISDGKVCVSDASCKDKLDVAQGKIYKTGQSIICLPNRLSIAVKGRKDIDALSY